MKQSHSERRASNLPGGLDTTNLKRLSTDEIDSRNAPATSVQVFGGNSQRVAIHVSTLWAAGVLASDVVLLTVQRGATAHILAALNVYCPNLYLTIEDVGALIVEPINLYGNLGTTLTTITTQSLERDGGE